MKIIAAQINPLVGDIEGNTALIIDILNQFTSQQIDLIVFTELCITGYPPEDLLMRPNLYHRCELAVEQLKQATEHSATAIIVGLPTLRDQNTYNSALCIHQGRIIAQRDKEFLPNYTVFDEKRYFTPGHQPCTFKLKGITIGLIICEDTWFKKPAMDLKKAGAELIISINASPFDRLKSQAREMMLIERSQETQLPFIYVNCVGGQDEIVFDGGSMALNVDNCIVAQADYFKTDYMELTITTQPVRITPQILPQKLGFEEKIYNALVLGVGDYIRKNNFPGAIIGLSGGIDSALTLAIAADAIGAENILGVLMPSRYTANMSNEDAITEAKALGTPYQTIAIEPMLNSFLDNLQDSFAGKAVDATEQNIQARIRGTIVMALSNKFGSIVLTTGNKSELSVGYCTLYGDMAGGFAVLKDIPKTLVYKLAEYRNKISPVIPERVITRAPSAELAPDQTDQDSLPDYDTLDAIINLYIEQDKDPDEIIKQGYDRETVLHIVKLINRNEYKRRQAPPGIRTCNRAFGKDRRYPITSGYFQGSKEL
jgi:NAD+ synthase (glutamine-hydrolysing)